MKSFKAYKVFDEDWKCQDYDFKDSNGNVIDTVHEIKDDLVLCSVGFHFCRKLSNCFSYKDFSPKNKIAEIKILGNYIGDPEEKECTSKFQILRELSWAEVLDLCNSGYGNSGNENSGNWNSGNENSGNWNSGNENSGNWNSGNRNSGCFNSITPDRVMVFNKWISKDDFNKIIIPDFFYFDLVVFVGHDTMSDKEQKLHKKDIEAFGGFYKTLSYKEAFKLSYKNANKQDREKIKDIIGFDKDIFFEISGIDVDKDDI